MSDRKVFRIIAVANCEFYGDDVESAKWNFMHQAETLREEDWTFIHVEEIKKK